MSIIEEAKFLMPSPITRRHEDFCHGSWKRVHAGQTSCTLEVGMDLEEDEQCTGFAYVRLPFYSPWNSERRNAH